MTLMLATTEEIFCMLYIINSVVKLIVHSPVCKLLFVCVCVWYHLDVNRHKIKHWLIDWTDVIGRWMNFLRSLFRTAYNFTQLLHIGFCLFTVRSSHQSSCALWQVTVVLDRSTYDVTSSLSLSLSLSRQTPSYLLSLSPNTKLLTYSLSSISLSLSLFTNTHTHYVFNQAGSPLYD